jgi:hypothetical protein
MNWQVLGAVSTPANDLIDPIDIAAFPPLAYKKLKGVVFRTENTATRCVTCPAILVLGTIELIVFSW